MASKLIALDSAADPVVFIEGRRETALREIPLALPIADNSDPESNGVNFLSQYGVLSVSLFSVRVSFSGYGGLIRDVGDLSFGRLLRGPGMLRQLFGRLRGGNDRLRLLDLDRSCLFRRRRSLPG